VGEIGALEMRIASAATTSTCKRVAPLAKIMVSPVRVKPKPAANPGRAKENPATSAIKTASQRGGLPVIFTKTVYHLRLVSGRVKIQK
jgi:hypothetical protein